jgi:AcrR family transcriptional regulator
VRAVTRSRSASSQRNDELLLDAGSAEIVALGVDRLAMSAVARRAGLTTGALYSRYENVAELAAAVWTSRVRDQHHAILDLAIRGLVDRERGISFDPLLNELSAPSPTTLLALEFLATARRIDELEEVVLVDVRDWLADWHAGPRSSDKRRRAQVIFTLATVWGAVLHEIPGDRRLDWGSVTRGLRWSFARPYEPPSEPLAHDRVGPVLADTGDVAQDALIDSVASIVARVGSERASATRIARRAGLTAGSIYTRYRTKEDLLSHAVEILLAARLHDDLPSVRRVISSLDAGSATATLVSGYLSAPRRDWRRFRIEAQFAARHRSELARALDATQEKAIREYLDTVGAKNDQERRELDMPARAAHITPLGLAFVDLVVPGVPDIDWRLVLRPLLTQPSSP